MRPFAFIFALSLLSLSVRSQEWAPVGATWHYTMNIFMPTVIDQDYIKFESAGDTLYNGKLCRKIIKYNNVSCTDRPAVEYMYSQHDTVWFWDPNFSAFQILYDFGAGPGDSWVILVAGQTPPDADSLIVRVDSTDRVVINGVSLKRLFVTYDFRNEMVIPDTYKGVIIQSAGDTYFMFDWGPEYLLACDGNFSGGLRCYQDGVIGLYETGIADSCTYVHYMTGIEPVNGETERIRIYPNPADDAITIESSIAGQINFTISDVAGRMVRSGRVTGSPIGINDLQPGIYNVLFYQHGQQLAGVKKLVVR
jgi:hypothetical protein